MVLKYFLEVLIHELVESLSRKFALALFIDRRCAQIWTLNILELACIFDRARAARVECLLPRCIYTALLLLIILLDDRGERLLLIPFLCLLVLSTELKHRGGIIF